MSKRLFLLDAFALIYRAYYALIRNPRMTSKGINTNAQFGFTNTLFDLISKEKPTHLAVCFDTFAPTERHTDFADYKANRQETPEDLLASIDHIKKIILGFNIPVIELDGYEADDVIGTLAFQASDAGYEVFMVTPDKDYGQLLTRENIFMYKPGYQGGDAEILDAKMICEKWNIEKVEQVIDLLALMGDSVDNIPGIAGIGEKTGAKLLKEYHSLENILEQADHIKGALGDKIRNGRENAIMSKKLATIITHVPVEFHEENFRLKEWNIPELIEIFTELEFKSLGKRILGEEFNVFQTIAQPVQTSLFDTAEPIVEKSQAPHAKKELNLNDLVSPEIKNISTTEHQYLLTDSDEKINILLQELSLQKEISFDTETTNIDANNAQLVGMSFSYEKHHAYYVPLPSNQEKTQEILQKFIPIFQDPNILWVGQNLKYDLLVLKWYDIEIKGKLYDTMLAHYVIEPEGRRSMDLLSTQYLQYEPVSITELIGKGKTQGNMRDVEMEKIKEYAAEDADITLQLKNVFLPLLKEKEVEKVFYEVENPLVKVLRDMEFEGIKIDEPFLKKYSVELEAEAKRSEANVFEQCGVKFNLSSPKQLGEILFDLLKLDDKAKKTKTGQYATGEDVLLRLAHKSTVVADILAFRELTKLRSTYVDALPLMINNKTGRVHTSFAQAVAVTGRLSSNNPNLQNIPIRTERGKEIRKAFIPRDDQHVLLSADYSQIELRIVAAISGDENMCDAFKMGKDIHTATAAKVFHIPEEEVTKEMRYKAKSVNFGIIYGQSAFGLADNLGIARSEAKEIIESYKKEFSGITRFMEDTIRFAKEHGYVQTLMGRKRWLRDINSSNFTVRGFAERNAINSPIQGTAADMIKMAMIKIHEALAKENLKTKMILQVHDELVFDVPLHEMDLVNKLVIENMCKALPLPHDLPVIAEVGHGKNWLEAH
ncbi:MAG: DNA polymerase I [Bacteroidetes bacterium]|nr:DNA polymerase I [Bacteroidota bacterium]